MSDTLHETAQNALLPKDTRRSLPMALLRAREMVMSRFRPMLDAHNITEQQWRVLRVLDESGQMDASQVAAKANILSPSLTRMIRSMTERGLIGRGRDDNDGRRVMLEIAPTGAMLIATVSPHSHKITQQLSEQYGEEKLATLLALLDELAHLPDETA